MRNFTHLMLFAILLCLTSISANATIRYVKPSSTSTAWSGQTNVYTDINAAITASASGDEIWVAAGTYKPTTGTNRNISFSLKNGIKLLGGFAGTETSSSARNWNTNKTILSGEIGDVGTAIDNSYHVVSAVGTSSVPFDATTILDGFIVEKGYSNNYGGGVYCQYASLVVQNCLIRNNYANSYGGGIYGYSGNPSVINCIITQNKSGIAGAGICADDYSKFSLVNITVTNNTSTSSTGGIDSWGGTITGVNLISWGNTPSINDGSYTYSCVEGGSGTGVINKDPQFIDAASGDFRLNIQSACIDKGSSTAVPSGTTLDIMQNTRIQGDAVDMGAFEGGIVTPIAVSPANNSGIKGIAGGNSVTFSWKWAAGAAPSDVTGYKFQYWTSKADTVTTLLSNLTTTVNLAVGQRYFWRTGAITSSNLINWAVISQFEISHLTPLYVKQGATGNGTSWASAYGKLQNALSVACYGDEVWVAAGTYKPAVGTNRDSTFSLTNGVKLLGGFAGTETASTGRNWDKNKTILSGDIGVAGTATDNSRHVVSIFGSSSVLIDSTTVLDGFIIEKGYASNANSTSILDVFASNSGGGICCAYASPVIQNSLIRNNYAYDWGGGILGNIGNPKVINCILSQNKSTQGGGGLMSYESNTNFKLINVTATGNSTNSNYTGGLGTWNGYITGVNVISYGNNPSSNFGTYTYSCIEGGSGTGVISKDPIFIDAAYGDFRLNSKSPCVNKGSNAAVPTSTILDLALNTRIQKDTVDMGALEGAIITPVLVLPANNTGVKGIEGGNAINFSWKWTDGAAPSDVTGYKFQYWTSKGDTTTVATANMSATVTLAIGNQYYWRVGSINSSTLVNWSLSQKFSISHLKPFYVKQGSSGDGSSWSSALGKLQDALKVAVFGDEIWVATGTYKPATTGRDSSFSIPNGVKVLGGFAGTETSSSARNWNANKTILSGDIGASGVRADNSNIVIQVVGTSGSPIDTTTTLDGLIIENAYNPSSGKGAGIYCYYASPKILNSIIQNNYVVGLGGGICCYYGSPKVINCIINSNRGSTTGGAIYAYYATPNLINLTITKNSSNGIGGLKSDGGSITGKNIISYANIPSGNDGAYTYSCIEGGSGTGTINKDPLFMDASKDDFRLNAASPCINKGSNAAIPSGVNYDIALNARIQKDTVDMGAYEGGIVTPVPVSPANNSGIKSTSATMSVTFSWKWASGTAPSNVTGYKLQYWTAAGDTTTTDASGVTSTLTLSAAKQYYWRVRAIDGGLLPNWSPIYSFSTSHNGPLYVKQGSSGDGSSWSSALGKLQDALKVAVYGDEIWVATGTYKPATTGRDSSFSIPNGVKVLGGFAGTETSSSARNWNSNPTILSGDIGTAGTVTDNSYHVVSAVGTSSVPIDATTILDGFIIEKGYSSGYGGGVYCQYASLVVQNCLIQNNYASSYGGGVYGYYGGPSAINCVITQNKSGWAGAGIYADSYSKFNLVNITVTNNTSTIYSGGIFSWAENITGVNLISWGNTPSDNSGSYTYSCIEGGSGTGVISKDPLFIDAANGDFRLNSKSPCINKGSNAAIPSGISTDIALNARIQKDTVDMGACEGGIVTPIPASPTNNSGIKATSTNPSITFNWKWTSGTTPSNVTGYKLQYWTASGDTTTVDASEITSTLSLSAAKQYYWRVRAIDGGLLPNWSPIYSFSTSHNGPLYVKQGVAGGDGSSWKYAYDKLQTALKAAFYGDEIWVAAGTYYPAVSGRDSSFSIPNGVTILGGFAGTETASSARKWTKNKTILSGDIGTAGTVTDNSSHVVSFTGSSSSPIDTTTILDGLIIEKGYATSNYGGGGIYSAYASPKIQNCLIRNNYSTNYGGGIYGYSGNPKLINCVLIRNTAISGGGGLVADDYSKFSLINVTVSKNSSNSSNGGIYSWGGSISGTNTISYANKPSSNSGSYTYSCIEGLTSGTGNINKYPMFADTLNNDFHLKIGSPCIDAGNNSATSLTTDMNNLSRITSGKIDMGAYESAYPKVTNPQNLSGINPSGGIVTYRWTLGNSNEGNGDPYSSSGTSPFSIKVWNKTDNTKVFENTTVYAYALPSMNYTYGTGYQWRVGTVTDDYTYWSDTTTFYIGKDHPIYVKQGATGDGTSWDNAMGSVKDALEATIPGDEIWVAAGTYYPTSGTDRTVSFTLKPYISLLGGFAGTENFKAERNCTKNITILSGDIGKANDASDNSNHVIYNKYTQASPLQGGIIDGFVITGGNAATDNGGAMYNEYASPTIYNCIFRQNQSANGGAIANISSSPLIYNSLFYGNQATTAGGAVYNDNSSASKLINCTVSSNTATSGAGVSGPATIGNSIIYGNGTSEIGGTPTVTYSCVKGGYTGTGNVSGDPDFVSTSTNDFRLGKYSSCFNKGSNSLVPTDQFLDLWNHEDRIFVSTVDIGAYELNILEVGRVSVDSISPAKNATITDLYAPVTVYFNRPVSIKDASGIIMAPNNPVISITLENGGKRMAINPTNPWSYSTPYKISIPASSLVLAANELIGFSKDSALFTIRACIPAKIKFASTDTSFCPDIAPILSVSTTGEAKTDYQWSFNGTNLSNDGKASWTLTNFSNSQVGTYVCSISDLCGNTTQGSINVTLNPKITYPVIDKKWNDVLFVDNSSQKFSSYQWALNGTSLNLSSQYITMSSISGTYEVSALDAGSGCRVKSYLTLASQQKTEISMYPNPAKASQSITVNFGHELESGTIKLYNLNGSLVFTAPFSFSSRYILEHTNLNSGVYILEVTSNGISNKSKLIIEK